MDVCGCRDYDVAVFGGEKKNFSLLQLLIYIIDFFCDTACKEKSCKGFNLHRQALRACLFPELVTLF
jgi:hypothetical protein